MFPFEAELTSSDDLLVLAAYAAAEEDAAKARKAGESAPASASDVLTHTDPSDTDHQDAAAPKAHQQTWVRRIREVEGVDDMHMAPSHGRLIAHGLLQFQLQGQGEGVMYRLTSAGRQAIAVATESAPPAESEAA